MMGNLVIVTGIGHAATKWLATVLDRPDEGVAFYHEPLMSMVPQKSNRWIEVRRLEMNEGVRFPGSYNTFVEDTMRQYCTVGDSMSWLPLATLTILRKPIISRIIFIVRHGVPQLHSVFTKSLWNQYTKGDFLYAEYLRRYWEIYGAPWKDWEEWTRWEMLCLWWNTNVFMPEIAARYTPVEVHRMEDLTQDAAYLKSFCHTFGLTIPTDELEALQGEDINRKVAEDRTPKALWGTWTREQQDAFRRICGPGMEELDYDMP